MIKSLFHWKAANWAPSLFGVSNDLSSKLNFIKWIYLFIPWRIDIDSKRKYKITHLSNEIAKFIRCGITGRLLYGSPYGFLLDGSLATHAVQGTNYTQSWYLECFGPANSSFCHTMIRLSCDFQLMLLLFGRQSLESLTLLDPLESKILTCMMIVR